MIIGTAGSDGTRNAELGVTNTFTAPPIDSRSAR